jgi:hypothetical protein
MRLWPEESRGETLSLPGFFFFIAIFLNDLFETRRDENCYLNMTDLRCIRAEERISALERRLLVGAPKLVPPLSPRTSSSAFG